MTNPLVNVTSPGIRAALYWLATLASLAFTAWQASDGDWNKAIPAFIAAVLLATAGSNASPTPAKHRDEGGYADVGFILLLATFVMVLLIFLGWHPNVIH